MLNNPYLHVVISSAVVYIFITIAIRIFGKKELAQLSVLDIVFVLLISNSVQNAMVGSDTSLIGGLIAAGTLFVLNYLFKYMLFSSKRFTHFLEGEPVILVVDGKVKDKNLRKMEISTDELLEAIREHGVQSIHDVNLAMLEVDGNLSVMSNDFKKRSVNKVVKKKKEERFGYR